MQDRDYEVKKNPKIYVSNLDTAVSEYDLRRFFEKFGNIVDVVVKPKESISFAFIEFESVEEAENAIQGSNGKSILDREMKVYFAKGGNERRSFGDRGRGRPFGGDRGGYRDQGDEPRRRDFGGGDRPRGCFNCGEEGHMARDCPQPRKPREFNTERRPYDGDRPRYGGDGERRGGFGDRSYPPPSDDRKPYGDRGGYGDRRGRDAGDRDRDRGGRDRGGRDFGDRRHGDRDGGYRGEKHRGRRRSNSSNSSRSRDNRGKKGARSPSSGSR